MVKITNGRRTFEVSAGAFESVYKGLGFHKVGVTAEEPEKQGKKKPKEEVPPDTKEKEEDETGDEDDGKDHEEHEEEEDETGGLDMEALLEKPLSQWTPDELKEFVQTKGIDTSGATKVKEVRAIVKQYLEEQAKNG